jgi:hypothetical protein
MISELFTKHKFDSSHKTPFYPERKLDDYFLITFLFFWLMVQPTFVRKSGLVSAYSKTNTFGIF